MKHGLDSRPSRGLSFRQDHPRALFRPSTGRMNRRIFLKSLAATALPSAAAAASYGLYEATCAEVIRPTLALPRLPAAFDGTKIAFLADIHHGPFTTIEYVVSVVRTTLSL